MQQYARGDYDYMSRLLINCARFCILLVGIVVVPLLIGMNEFLGLWLVEVPEFTAVFARVALMAACGELLSEVLSIGVHATGRITGLSVITGILSLVELLSMWLMLKITHNAPVVYVVHLVFMFVLVGCESMILKSKVRMFGVRRFWLRGVFTPLAILGCSTLATWLFVRGWGHLDLWQLMLMGVTATMITALLGWIFAIDSPTRQAVLRNLRARLHV